MMGSPFASNSLTVANSKPRLRKLFDQVRQGFGRMPAPAVGVHDDDGAGLGARRDSLPDGVCALRLGGVTRREIPLNCKETCVIHRLQTFRIARAERKTEYSRVVRIALAQIRAVALFRVQGLPHALDRLSDREPDRL